MSYIQKKKKIIELEEQIVFLSAKIVHLETKSDKPQKIQTDDEVLKEVYLDIDINDTQFPEKQLEAYKQLENRFTEYIGKQKEFRLQTECEQNEKIVKLNQLINKLTEEVIRLNKNNKEEEEENKEEEMNIEPKDAIPVFSGDSKDFGTFVNTCDLYNQLILAHLLPKFHQKPR